MGASASLIEKATPEQQGEINAEYEKLKNEGLEEEEIEKRMKEKYNTLLEAIGETVELTYGMKDALGWKLQFCAMISFQTSNPADASTASAALATQRTSTSTDSATDSYTARGGVSKIG